MIRNPQSTITDQMKVNAADELNRILGCVPKIPLDVTTMDEFVMQALEIIEPGDFFSPQTQEVITHYRMVKAGGNTEPVPVEQPVVEQPVVEQPVGMPIVQPVEIPEPIKVPEIAQPVIESVPAPEEPIVVEEQVIPKHVPEEIPVELEQAVVVEPEEEITHAEALGEPKEEKPVIVVKKEVEEVELVEDEAAEESVTAKEDTGTITSNTTAQAPTMFALVIPLQNLPSVVMENGQKGVILPIAEVPVINTDNITGAIATADITAEAPVQDTAEAPVQDTAERTEVVQESKESVVDAIRRICKECSDPCGQTKQDIFNKLKVLFPDRTDGSLKRSISAQLTKSMPAAGIEVVQSGAYFIVR